MLQKTGNKPKYLFFLILFLFFSSLHNLNLKINFSFINISEVLFEGKNNKINRLLKNELDFINGKNIYLLEKDHIENKLQKYKFIKNLSLKKEYPQKIVINFEITEFVAYFEQSGAISLINEYGEIISDSFFQTDKSIPYYVGNFEKESFINLKKNIDKLNLQIEKYYFLPSKRWDLELKNGIIIKLPIDGPENALNLASQFIKKFEDKKNYSIDLRVLDYIVLSDV
tara:strand:- start:8766 stop:9446 length:681 start_codon:yes stop_codon:yes gene_type:complete